MSAKTTKTHGFTLVELLMVIVLLGIIGAIASNSVFNTGSRDSASAQLVYGTGETIVSTWRDIVRSTRTSPNPTSGVFFEDAVHDALDVITHGNVAVSTTFDNWFTNFGPSRISTIATLTAPTATTTGVYAIEGDMVVSISGYDAATRAMSIQFTQVTSGVVEVLKAQYEPNSAFDAAAADNAGVIQHSVAANNLHTLTVIYSL